MTTTLSPERKRLRDALRVLEVERLRSIHLLDLAERAGIHRKLVAMYVRMELSSGLRAILRIGKTMEHDGRAKSEEEADRILDSLVRSSPYPMWCNLSREFGESIFMHLTRKRFLKLLGKWDWKNSVERIHKRSYLDQLVKTIPELTGWLTPIKASKSLDSFRRDVGRKE